MNNQNRIPDNDRKVLQKIMAEDGYSPEEIEEAFKRMFVCSPGRGLRDLVDVDEDLDFVSKPESPRQIGNI